MEMFKKLSLKTKIVSSVMVAVLLVAAGAFFSIWSIQTTYKKTIADSFADNAKSFGIKVATQYYERYGDVQAFAVNPVLKTLDAKQISPILDQYVSLYGIYDLILVVDADGRPIASNLKDTASKEINVKALRNLNYSSANWFKAVMAGETTDDKEKGYSGTYVEDFISDPILKIALGEQRFGTSFSSAVKDETGKIIAVITNRTNSRWFEADLKPFYEALKEQDMPTSQFMIINRRGNVIANYDPIEAGGKLEVVHDPQVLLKQNPASTGYAPAIEAQAGKSGFMYAPDMGPKGGHQIVGYHMIDNFKWPKSLGWTVYISADEDDAFIEIEHAMHTFYIGFAFCLALSIFIGFWVANTVSKSIAAVTQTMSLNAAEVQTASQTIASSAVQLSESATQQAAALQETVAAVDEISAMVEKNAEAAGRSKEVSVQSRDAAERGRGIVENMIQAIGEIDHANEEISSQMQASNRELSEITTLINDIGSKTKVINEIVFQTKLLSFNASVEAARAGEYGKGFAVVAEEVGNLAEMSGSAAKEISSLLETSVRKVEAIVDQTKDRVDRLTATAKEKVKSGSDVARECNSALEEILENVQSVDALVSEIAVASSEQSTGIREISKAVGQMEQVTQQNSVVAQSSSGAATQLSDQSTELNSLVQDLSEVVTGSRTVQAREAGSKSTTSTRKPKSMAKAKVVTLKTHAAPVEDKVDEPQYKMAASDYVPSSHDSGFEE